MNALRPEARCPACFGFISNGVLQLAISRQADGRQPGRLVAAAGRPGWLASRPWRWMDGMAWHGPGMGVAGPCAVQAVIVYYYTVRNGFYYKKLLTR